MLTAGHHEVVVLGAGLSGLAASERLHRAGVDVLVVEREERAGGLARSWAVDGFTFDQGPHVSFTKQEEIQRLFAAAVNGRYREARAALLNRWKGIALPHPAQSHLHGLPVDLVARCLVDFVEARQLPAGTPRTYADWCVAHLGRTFSEEFSFAYTRKFWTAEAAQLGTDWIGERVHAPPLKEVVRGALGPTPAVEHYLTRFRYPLSGGFEPYVASVRGAQPIALGEEVAAVDAAAREVRLASGAVLRYERLVSSLPLPELVGRLAGAPHDVVAAAGRLRCTSAALVSVGVARADGFPDADWMYFYDEDVAFARAHFPHRLAAANAPAGCGSIQVEVYHSPYRPLPPGPLLDRCVEDLRRTGLLRPDDRILAADERRVPYANVLFDLERAGSLATVQAHLAAAGIECCGRFGEWGYLWSDDAIQSGWRAAERVQATLRAKGART